MNFIKFCFIIFTLTIVALSTYASQEVIVYYSTTLSARDRQGAFSDDGISALVFGQYKEFEEAVQKNNPQMIIAPPTFNLSHKDYTPQIKFKIENQTQSSYLLLSLVDKWNTTNLKDARIGMIEESDRTTTKDYLKSLFKTDFKLIKVVTKVEDIFPLLVFKSVDIILISQNNYEELKKKYAVTVHTVLKTKPIDNPTVFVKNKQENDDIIKKIISLKKNNLKILGFDGLEKIGTEK